MKFNLPSINPSLKRLLTYLPPYRWQIVLAVVFMVAAGAASSLIATLLGKLTDIGFYNQEPWIVVAAPIGLVLISILHGGSMFMSNFLLGKVSQSVLSDLRAQIYQKLIRWPAPSYQANNSSAIASKFVFEANVALSNATKSCIILVRDSWQVISLTIVLLWHNWTLALVSLVIVPLVAMTLRAIANKMRAVMATCQESFATVLTRVRETYDGHRLVKLSNAYDLEVDRFSSINRAVQQMMLDMTKITSLGTPLTQLICMTGVAIVLAFAMYQAHIQALTLGDFVTFLAALLLMIPPLKNLAGVNTGFVMMGMAAESIFASIDEHAEDNSGKETLDECRGEVTFENVSLRYPGASTEAVRNFSLTAPTGSCIALVGLSGAGKSSIVHMIPRFWNPTEGRILIDGRDIRTFTLESLRKHIAIVSQDVFLFDDTIRNNIAYGMPNATDQDVAKVVEAAALTDFIASLPQGLDTFVGEAGNRLSGGQKQRLSIARALLKNAPILILDEATSALDSQSEAQIKVALLHLLKGRTTFIVAHRLSTIEHATTIIAMAGGEIKEQGTRDELLAKNGLYAELCRLQALSPISENGGPA
ncbi:MAG: lipid A export permease/ATP-binding protein MsbA [Sutterella sp. 63_29]|nr:MAG: lipid A export permease/ATP-binding protein MsbA [Sutterella sp. 63_29]